MTHNFQAAACRAVFAMLVLSVPLVSIAQSSETRLIDIGGFRVNVSEAGSGTPPVVFENGLGEDLTTWNDVQPKISAFAHTVTYDRGGLGRSDPSPNSRSIEQLTAELHTMLHAAGVAPPYILVGHSLGGAIVELFAYIYPDEVAGLVLVDPEDGRLLDRLHAKLGEAEWTTRQHMLDQMLSGASPGQKAELESVKTSGEAFANRGPLPHVPIVLLTGTLKDPSFPGNPTEQDLKLEIHQELLHQNPQAQHVLAPNSRHYIQNDAPDLVIGAVSTVVDACRKSAAPAATH